MREVRQTIFGVVAVVALLSACATPNWSGMSETQIAEWKGLDVGPEVAQNWVKEGFGPQDYTAWTGDGFDLKSAAKWKAKAFTSAEAAKWKKAGFNVDRAFTKRAKGLTPITEEGRSKNGNEAQTRVPETPDDSNETGEEAKQETHDD
jgi:hypothetical protein